MKIKRRRIAICSILLVTCSAAIPARTDGMHEVRGRVVGQDGKAVAGAAVGCFWRANGTGNGPDGKQLDLEDPVKLKEFWGNLGRMEPVGRDSATTDAEGRFAVTIKASRHALMAMDSPRERGGLVVLPKGKDDEPVEIRVGPMVKVRGALKDPSAKGETGWTHVYVNMPDDPERPLDATRLVSCGSFDSRFEMSLPPGPYVLDGYTEARDADLGPAKTIVLAAGDAEVDLGVLLLSKVKDDIAARSERGKSDGTWIDVAQRFGRPAPEWRLTDARGVPKGARVQDFRGKWLLIYFWGFGCAPCLGTELPALARFYEDHQADRNRFEVVAVCIDDDEASTSMAAVDRKLENVVKHVWGGKALPFPVVLDASYQSMENFGVTRFGPLLVDPDGDLILGDLTTLTEKLKRVEPPTRP
ncbi:redoxin domain-containing protein [Paludisphaera borealis]|uniref:Thiol-disulfide oxidoreductase ResA n=1 Tax=Paludisphaera borealis TaxID=1387353 RepID=A0A1U7CSV5_9BACT|nr:redoxin domain-containing protein [Paludisphaera borealis]APW62011.1 Thiol-disulfide oxidoreductase ResA [Paludisphaera borealis]